jgi:hypothetical protein
VDHIVRSGAFRSRNVDALFFMLGCAWCGSCKKRDEIHYVELAFLHPVRSVGHVMCSRTSGVQNINTLFFMLG